MREIHDDLLDSIPNKFKKLTYIMSKEATKHVLGHYPYNQARGLKHGENLSWGLCYALREKELEVPREWLKQIPEIAKI
jgi:hypothetical protein